MNTQLLAKAGRFRPHDIEVSKATEKTNITLKDWQHLGALIRIELTKVLPDGNQKAVFAEMPNEQFKRLQLNRGDNVQVKIHHAHWFH
jgi:sulfate/thiosulfate transport system ATP-binding protein